MSAEDRQELPFLNAAGKSNNVSHIRPYPVTSNSYSLEDGEVKEINHSYIYPTRTELQASPFPTAKPVASLAPTTVEPMTKEDLDRAKSLVLDLLGWGVTPEYLVNAVFLKAPSTEFLPTSGFAFLAT